MIERPKRSVTRFFVPLIDVLILLFCIFLLMPFVASSSEAEPDAKAKEKRSTPNCRRTFRNCKSNWLPPVARSTS